MFPGYPSVSGSGMIVGKLESNDPVVKAAIADGWPSLLEAMNAAQINTPARQAAFLTTLVFESGLRYNRRQISQTRKYYGRGYIQLTGRSTDPDANGYVMNYTDAGRYLGVDLVGSPDLALDIRYSARIAAWYWTSARPSCNAYADALRMGKINAAIGYPRDGAGTNDNNRCMVFRHALETLTGGPLPGAVDCTR